MKPKKIKHAKKKFKIAAGEISDQSIASFSISYMGDWDLDVERLMMSYAKELFGSIQHVKKIELGDRFTSLLSLSRMDSWQLPPTGRECLIVDGDIAVIVDLLETSPNLETLVIKSWFPYQDLVQGFDQEAVVVVMARLASYKAVCP